MNGLKNQILNVFLGTDLFALISAHVFSGEHIHHILVLIWTDAHHPL
jgi:hypothetical protein